MADALSCFMRDLISSIDNSSSYDTIIISDNAKTIQAPPSSTKKRRTPHRSASSPLHLASRWEGNLPFTRTTPKSCHSNPNVSSPPRISRWASSSTIKSNSFNSSLPNLDYTSLSPETSPGGHLDSSFLRQPVRQSSLNKTSLLLQPVRQDSIESITMCLEDCLEEQESKDGLFGFTRRMGNVRPPTAIRRRIKGAVPSN
jgi:hypothetical protein